MERLELEVVDAVEEVTPEARAWSGLGLGLGLGSGLGLGLGSGLGLGLGLDEAQVGRAAHAHDGGEPYNHARAPRDQTR